MQKSIVVGPAPSSENDHNAEWIRRQSETPESRRHYEQERLIVWATEVLAEGIEESSLSRREIADLLGTSKSHISQALSGGRNLTLRTISDIAWATGHRICITSEPLRAGVYISTPVKVMYKPQPRVVRAMVENEEELSADDCAEFLRLECA